VTKKQQTIHQNMPTEDLFHVMADCAPVLLWISREDSACVFFNKTWLDFTGKTLEQEWGVGWTEGIHFEDFQKCIDTYMLHFNKRTSFEMEYRLRRHDGEYRWVLDRGVPYYSSEGVFLGFIGSCIDTSENKQAKEFLLKMNEELELRVSRRTAALKASEAALAQEKRKAEEATRIKSEFVSTVSHELRTPMTAIKGSLELILHGMNKENKETEGQLEPLIKIAYQNTTRMLRLIRNILDIEKNAAGKLPLHLKKHCLGPLVEQAIVSNNLFAEHYQVSIRYTNFASDAYALIDEDRFAQVLDNLLSNAVKFSKAQGEVIVAMIRLEANHSLCLSVKDCGRGITPEFQGKVFSQFAQEEGNPDASLGTGLGLNIAKSIIELHQGSIRFETSSSGTTFYIELPEVAAEQ
jgi:PAS domain S-box-containing protein